MSKPEHNSRRQGSSSATFLQRLFSRRRETRQHEPPIDRGRHRSNIGTSSHRRVRLVFFSTWGSDYRQIDLSAAKFTGLLLGFACIFSALTALTAYGITRLVQSYRLVSLTDDQQILRNRLNQMQARVQNLGRRLDGLDGEGALELTARNELPAFRNLPEEAGNTADGGLIAETGQVRQSGSAKRGPLGLAWTDSSKTLSEQNEREVSVFYGQGGGAFIDDEDNIYPNLLEKERANSFIHASKTAAENNVGEAASAGGDLISQLEAHLSKTQVLQKTIVAKFELRRKQLEHIPSIKPLLSGRITDLFGKRKDPFVYRTRHHQGLDIGAPRGTEVFAPANGVVEFVKTSYRRNRGYGRAVVINHGYGIKTLYGHLFEVKVKAGQKIERWDIVGLVGETGRATGPHLHYEVWVDGEATDPMRFILNN
ncbi:M23 family metallopeptidase [candidate division KSB1 bacterium]|nr:M23 family metallopeptidase [candidate division KSB1 bacterium]